MGSYDFFRITPACAGNRGLAAYPRGCPRDHPRVCGEQHKRRRTRMTQGGSPPRVRGTDSSGASPVSLYRITPACAGNSLACGYKRCPHRDHPRVCGEQQLSNSRTAPSRGSPPRVRGTGVFRPGYLGGHGITPACAGNSSTWQRQQELWQDHPRVCGEQPACRQGCFRNRGSPPRVRGTVDLSHSAPPTPRITPACAGNS